MDLKIKDIAHLLVKSEKDVLRLVKAKDIPHQVIHDRIVFNKDKVIEWALGRNMPLNISDNAHFEEYRIKTLLPLLNKHSFFYNCTFTDDHYIEEMVQLASFDKSVDRSVIIQLLKSREQMMSTAIGHGISLPHPRIPLVIGRDKPLILFFFPDTFLNLHALDGKPVHTLILIISQTIKQHLSLLAHLSHLLSKSELRQALKTRQPYSDIMALIKSYERPAQK
ncbi:MAG: PTS sugar transporter subunit IIA [Bacteroidetes bacterium]|nr:PTS sugar transporter subunit IIA [Bacteroidota bacterium]